MSDWTPAPAATSLEWEHIDTTVLSSPAASVVFSGISSVYRKLRHISALIKDATNNSFHATINNTTADYAYQRFTSSGASAAGTRNTAQNRLFNTSDSIVANGTALCVIELANPVTGEDTRSSMQAAIDGSGAGFVTYESNESIWDTSGGPLVSRIDIIANSGNFDTGTRCTLGGARDTE